MSRFFASDSESESDISEEEPIVQKPAILTSAYTFSDGEEETKRVVRSAKEKRDEELTNIIKLMKNHKKIKDMGKLLTSFEDVTKAFAKAKPIYDKEEHGQTPKFYIRCLVELEDFINECWEDREGRKNMSKNNSKGLATLRQKVRKYNKDFEAELQKYRENPEDEDADEQRAAGDDEGSGAGSGSEDEVAPRKPSVHLPDEPAPRAKHAKAASGDEDSDSDSIDWGSSSDEESSSTDDDEKYGGNLAAKFLKKSTDKDDKEAERKKKEKKERREKKVDRKTAALDEDDGWEPVKGGVPMPSEKPKMFAKDAEINHQNVQKKLNEILAARGKKSTDRTEQIEMLTELLNISTIHELGPAFDLKIRFSIIAAIYDYNLNIVTCMKPEMWRKCLEQIGLCIDVAMNNTETLQFGEHVSDEAENLITSPYKVRGCLLQIVERMDEEFVKMLQACDPHSPDYVERLKDETLVCELIERLQGYLELKGSSSELCRVYLKRIEHIYYKFDKRVLDQDSKEAQNNLDVMEQLSKYIYAKDSTDRIRTQAILNHIYFLALHDRWYEARDLLLMSHLQDSIQHSDIPTQIMYNRALVQLGLCAFRHGNIKESHHALLDIQSGGRAKELLAQGLLPQRYNNERTTEQEKIEKRRQMPFHKHINLELLECVYLVSAMLLEVPQMAAHETDGRKHMISKSFHYQLRSTERQALVGPPESMREHVVAASKAMRVGNWKLCHQYIVNDKMNQKVWDLFHRADAVRAMMCQKIKEESLRTYLFMYSGVYDSLSLAALENLFELPPHSVHSIVSKMIINEELKASLDEPNRMIVLHRTEPTRIQALALQLCDKVYNLHDYNERLWELKQGAFFGRSMGGGQQGGQGQGGFAKGGDRQWNKAGRRQNQRY